MTKNEEMIDSAGIGENIGRIYCRLVGQEHFPGNPERVLHESFLDMRVIYDLRVKVSSGEYLGMIIRKENLAKWGLDEQQIKKLAWANTLRDEPAHFLSMDEILREGTGSLEQMDKKLYVLTNRSRHLGAVCLLYPGCLAQIAEQVGGNFFVLPSSIHECLILKCSADIKAAYLREMVRSINKTEVAEKEVLTDSVYRYIQSEDRLKIDNS